MKQLIAGVSDQQKPLAPGPRRDDMITVLEAMRVQLAELMKTIAPQVGQPLGVTGSASGRVLALDDEIARLVTRVFTIAQAIDQALAALHPPTERPDTDADIFRDGLASMPSYPVELPLHDVCAAANDGTLRPRTSVPRHAAHW